MFANVEKESIRGHYRLSLPSTSFPHGSKERLRDPLCREGASCRTADCTLEVLPSCFASAEPWLNIPPCCWFPGYQYPNNNTQRSSKDLGGHNTYSATTGALRRANREEGGGSRRSGYFGFLYHRGKITKQHPERKTPMAF